MDIQRMHVSFKQTRESTNDGLNRVMNRENHSLIRGHHHERLRYA